MDMLFADKEQAKIFLEEIEEEMRRLQMKKGPPPPVQEAGKRIYWEGYLTKQGNSVKTWRKRWFILKNNLLKYYR